MSTDTERLFTEFSKYLLRDKVDLSENTDLINEAFENLVSITGPDIFERLDLIDGTRLESGLAIAPKDAATCMTDVIRTSRYVRGLRNAIIEVRKRFPQERIEILYAGCGPFATLAIPICYEFAADEISFTLLDVHEASVEAAKKVFGALGLSKFVGEYQCADATKFAASKKYHMIVAEMMQRTLEKEPQVAATIHLSKFLLADGIFVPEKITISACLADLQAEFDPAIPNERVVLGDIGALTKYADDIETAILPIPDIQTDNLHLLLTTSIKIFDSIRLGDRESGITHPSIIFDIGQLKPGNNIEFKYRTGADPRFVWRVV